LITAANGRLFLDHTADQIHVSLKCRMRDLTSVLAGNALAQHIQARNFSDWKEFTVTA
jgi:hypothetical protein